MNKVTLFDYDDKEASIDLVYNIFTTLVLLNLLKMTQCRCRDGSPGEQKALHHETLDRTYGKLKHTATGN